MLKKSLLALAVIALAASVSAQDAPAGNSPPPPPAPRRGGIPPCMRQAGVSMSTYEQLRSIAENARLEVVNACLNDSLNVQQRRQQLESIHVSAHQKMEELVTPAQRKAFVACRQRHGERTNVEWFERPGGGCGARGGAASAPAPNESAPNEEQNSSAPPSKDATPPQ
jgi:Spy/CpxP family protein refolding chaperone